MSVALPRDVVPRSVLLGLGALVLVSFLYSLLVSGTLLLWALAWVGLLGMAIAVVSVWLFYRLVVAVERIAEQR